MLLLLGLPHRRIITPKLLNFFNDHMRLGSTVPLATLFVRAKLLSRRGELEPGGQLAKTAAIDVALLIRLLVIRLAGTSVDDEQGLARAKLCLVLH